MRTCKSTIKSRNYNKMSTNVGDGDGDDGDATVDDEDDAKDSKDPSPLSSCVVVMVEFFAVTAMEAAEQ
jgi:hypothetical protein